MCANTLKSYNRGKKLALIHVQIWMLDAVFLYIGLYRQRLLTLSEADNYYEMVKFNRGLNKKMAMHAMNVQNLPPIIPP